MPALNKVQLIGYLGKDPEITLHAQRQESRSFQLGSHPALEERR